MNEVAWCYLEGFGTKKDKVSRSVLFVLLLYSVHPVRTRLSGARLLANYPDRPKQSFSPRPFVVQPIQDNNI